jgi:hypothetical protein
MKYVRYLAFAVFTFVFGVAISPIRFYNEYIACGPRGSSSGFRSSYFIQTTSSYINYDSDAEASDAFKKKLSQALEVFDLSPKVNNKGVLIEQRAVALFYHQGNDEYYVVCFWRDGHTLRSISSRSYTHVREFEKRNF